MDQKHHTFRVFRFSVAQCYSSSSALRPVASKPATMTQSLIGAFGPRSSTIRRFAGHLKSVYRDCTVRSCGHVRSATWGGWNPCHPHLFQGFRHAIDVHETLLTSTPRRVYRPRGFLDMRGTGLNRAERCGSCLKISQTLMFLQVDLCQALLAGATWLGQ